MRKYVAVILSAVLLAAGLVATTGGASASHRDGHPYVPGVRTTCAGFLVGKPTNRQRAHVRADVNAPGSNYNPKGFINVSVRKFNGRDGDSGRFFTRGGDVDLYFGPLKPGRYSGSVVYEPRPVSSVFLPCSDGFFFKIRRNR